VELRPDVTLVDINLGNENGFELVRQLCGTGSVPTSSVILISAQGEQDYADLIAESPAAGFLSKPTLSAGAIFMLRGMSDGDPQGPLSEPR